MRSTAADTFLWLLVGAALAAAFVVAISFPGLEGSSSGRRAAVPVAPSVAAASADPAPAKPADPAPAVPAAEPAPPAPQPQPRPAPAPAGIVVAARSGDCWVEAREGSATGDVLFFGLVAEGRRIRLGPGRVWLRLGASENVVVTVGGKRMPLPGGTVAVLV